VGSPRQRPAEREGGGGSDGRDPPVSDRVRRGERAQRPRVPSAWAVRMGRARGSSTAQCGFSFSFFV